MTPVELLLAIIAVIFFAILVQVFAIAKRMRQHFPTDKESDYDFSQNDPMGHWEAHRRIRSETSALHFL
jgi:hypothetical protein